MSVLSPIAESLPGRPANELRVSERFACDVPASCQPPSDWKRGGQKWTARVRDISTGGLCLVLNRRFERGAGLAIEVPGADGESPSTLLARVVHVSAVAGGSWVLGCRFISPLSDEELAGLTRSTTPVEEVKNAVAPSRALSVANVLIRATLPGGQVIQRIIRKLNGAWPLAVGRTIGLRLPGGYIVKLRVDGCGEAEGRWVLECRFVGAPPKEWLQAAGR